MQDTQRQFVSMKTYSTFVNIFFLGRVLRQNLIARLVQFSFSSIAIVARLLDGRPRYSQA